MQLQLASTEAAVEQMFWCCHGSRITKSLIMCTKENPMWRWPNHLDRPLAAVCHRGDKHWLLHVSRWDRNQTKWIIQFYLLSRYESCRNVCMFPDIKNKHNMIVTNRNDSQNDYSVNYSECIWKDSINLGKIWYIQSLKFGAFSCVPYRHTGCDS